MDKNLIFITPTYKNPKRAFFINECIKIFSQIQNVVWILCEDNNIIDPEINYVLSTSGINYKYLSFGPGDPAAR